MTRFAAAVALVGILASACLGSGSASSASSASAASSQARSHTRALTRLVITYSVGAGARRPGTVHAHCPARATCRVEPVSGTTPRVWVLAVRRTLECDPASGGYADPQAACSALANLRRLLTEGPGECFCPLQFGITPAARGRVDGVATRIPLDFCTYCGLPGRPQHDLGILVPGAES